MKKNRKEIKMFIKRIILTKSSIQKQFTRNFVEKNILALKDRGFIKDIFPDNAGGNIRQKFITKQQTVYAGFDPTADSLHVGNLLVIIGLIHCQRGGHQPIALLGGATGLIGDPSGRKTERTSMGQSTLDKNLHAIEQQIQRIFQNHTDYIWSRKQSSEQKPLQDVKFVNNAEWYQNVQLIDFIANMGRHFRMGNMLSRSSVQTRLQSEAGMSFTEFTYQMFQAYDWWHLFKKYECSFQLGGSDQMGNIMSGYELIGRIENESVYGLTLPIITNEEGDKFGKSAGNAIWLDDTKTSPFSLYQFFVRVGDADVEQLLKLLTFLPLNEIADIMIKHRQLPELRDAQRKLAQELTLLIHGQNGLQKAESVSAALYKGSIEALATLSQVDIKQSFAGATICDILSEPDMSILELAMKAKCFPTESDAIRIMTAGGFYINQNRCKNSAEIITPSVHVLSNGLTLLRVGKKNYYIVNWIK